VGGGGGSGVGSGVAIAEGVGVTAGVGTAEGVTLGVRAGVERGVAALWIDRIAALRTCPPLRSPSFEPTAATRRTARTVVGKRAQETKVRREPLGRRRSGGRARATSSCGLIPPGASLFGRRGPKRSRLAAPATRIRSAATDSS